MDCNVKDARTSRSAEKLGGTIKDLLSECSLLLLSSAGVERGVGDMKHQLRLGWVGIRRCRIQIIVPKDLPTGRIAASTDNFVDERNEVLGVVTRTGAVPLGRGVSSMETTTNGEVVGRGEWKGRCEGMLRGENDGGWRWLRIRSIENPITNGKKKENGVTKKLDFF